MLGLCVPSSTRLESTQRTQWDYVFGSWNVDKIYFMKDDETAANFIEHEETSSFTRDKSIFLIDDYSEILEHRVLFSPLDSQGTKGETNLKDYTHIENCCYIFGSNNKSITILSNCDKVYIETDLHIFSWVAASIAMYDRHCKNGN